MVGDYMVMGLSKNKVILDTSALLLMSEGYNFFDKVEREFGNVEYIVPKSVVSEMNKLSKENLKHKKSLNLFMRLLDTYNMRIIETGNTYADKDLLEMDGSLFVTTDFELAKKLKDQGKKVLVLKQNRYYDFY
jgi:rRNA-processing protein FCF1